MTISFSVRFRICLAIAVSASASSIGEGPPRCSNKDCEILDGPGSGLSLLQHSAKRLSQNGKEDFSAEQPFGPLPIVDDTTTTTTTTTEHIASHQVAYVNVMRHGEKCEKDGIYLDALGYKRGDYLARCLTRPGPSMAMPYGYNPTVDQPNPVRVLVGGGIDTDSIRPMITALPLLEKLNIDLDMPCANHTDPGCMANNIYPLMQDKGTVVVINTYQMLPYMVALLNIPESGGYIFNEYNQWPLSCPFHKFEEPHCTITDDVPDLGWNASFPYEPVSSCFDQIWQIKFTRVCTDPADPALGNVCSFMNTTSGVGGPYYGWQAQSIIRLSEGFKGDANGHCDGGLKEFKDK